MMTLDLERTNHIIMSPLIIRDTLKCIIILFHKKMFLSHNIQFFFLHLFKSALVPKLLHRLT